jgi:cell division protein FtsB
MACSALLGVWLLVPAAAGAQDAAKIERLERQTELLAKQLKELQEELARTRKKTERVERKWKPHRPVIRPRHLPVLWLPRAHQFRRRRKG